MSFGKNFTSLGQMILRENYCEKHSRYYYKFCCECLKESTQRRKEKGASLAEQWAREQEGLRLRGITGKAK